MNIQTARQRTNIIGGFYESIVNKVPRPLCAPIGYKNHTWKNKRAAVRRVSSAGNK